MKARTTGTYALIALAAVMTAVVCFSRAAGVEAMYPFQRAWRAVSDKVGSRISGAWRGAAASAENVRLRREVASLALARDELARLEEENERLRRALDYSESARGAWFAAGVLARSSALAAGRHVLRADKGSLAGVAEGAVVSVPEGLVGRVVSVTPQSSVPWIGESPARHSSPVKCPTALPWYSKSFSSCPRRRSRRGVRYLHQVSEGSSPRGSRSALCLRSVRTVIRQGARVRCFRPSTFRR